MESSRAYEHTSASLMSKSDHTLRVMLFIGFIICSHFWVNLTSRVPSFIKSTFDFERLAPAGGKGGDNLTKTDDDLYFVKVRFELVVIN